MGTPTPRENDEAFIARAKARHARAEDDGVTPEMYLLAEFGYYFGWPAIQAVRNNEISMDMVHLLVASARKVWYSKVVDLSHGATVANVASNSKGVSRVFSKGMKPFTSKMKVKT